MVKPVWNNAQRVNHQNFAKKTHPYAKKNLVPRAVLMKSGLVSINIARQNISKMAVLVNTARQVNVAHSKTTVNVARPMSYLSKIAHSTVKRPIHKNTTFKNSNINQRVNTVRGKKFNTARPKAVVNVVKGNNFNVVKASACWGNPQMDLQDQGVIDSGCSRHMTGNMSYLTDYEEIDGGYVAFGGNPKGGKITGKCTIKTDHLGKFDGKDDEDFFVGYSLNNKAFRVFKSITRIVEENLHIRFSRQPNGFAGTKASDNACQARKETKPIKDYILLPLLTSDPPYSQDTNSSHDDGSKPSSDDGKKVNVVGGKTSIELLFDLNMHALEDYSIFNFSRDDEDDGAEADMNNLDKTIQVSLIPTTRIHKDHPLDQVIGDLQLATLTRKISKNLKEHGTQKGNSSIEGSKVDRGYARRASTIQVIRRYTQEEGINYDEVFAPVARIETIRLFLANASFKDFMVYQMDIKSDFLYEKIKEVVYVCQPPEFEDPDFPDRVYQVEKALYGLHQAPRAWYETFSTYLLDNGFQRGKTDKTLFIK
ncbi:putative ribonuclease H-like domain-containing protein [Tanacetum coccineum]